MAFGFGLGLTRGGGAGGLIPTFNANLLNGSLPQGATFSRGTVATQYNSSGLLQYAPSNLLLQSQALNLSPWITQTNVTLTSTNTGVAPDGTLTASLWTFSGTSNNSLYQGYNTAVNQTLTGSVYLKGQAGQTISVSWQPFSGSAVFTVWTLTGNWDRVSATATNGSTAGSGNFAISVTAGQTATAVYVWGAQLEQGPNATTYTPTTTAAVYGPRFDYDPGNVLQQNLLSYSVWPGTGGPGTYPTGWGYTGSNPTACSVAQGVVNGVSTGIVSYRRVGAAGYEGLQPSINIPQNYAPASTLTVSVWARIPAGVTATDLAYYDGSNVAVIATAATLAAAGNNWTFYSKTFTAIATSVLPGCFISNNPAAGIGSGFDIAQPQLNYGSTALPYLATTSTPQTVCAPKGLLIEEARTNLLTYSNTFSNAVWAPGTVGGTLTSNSTTSPDGTVNGSTLNATAVIYGGIVLRNQSFTYVGSTTYTLSCYAKAGTSNFLGLRVSGDCSSAGGSYPYFNLSTGVASTITPTAGTLVAVGMSNVGNGWWKCWVTFTTSATPLSNNTDIAITLANGATSSVYAGTENLYVYGAQLEAGAFPTSYIPTTSATVTRNADALVTTPAASPWFNGTVGTFVVQADKSAPLSGGSIIGYYNGTAYGYLSEIAGSGNGGMFDTSTTLLSANAISANTTFKLGTLYNDTGTTMSVCLNGGAVASATHSSSFSTTTQIGFGGNIGFAYLNGHLRSIQYFNYAMTNTQLQQVTT